MLSPGRWNELSLPLQCALVGVTSWENSRMVGPLSMSTATRDLERDHAHSHFRIPTDGPPVPNASPPPSLCSSPNSKRWGAYFSSARGSCHHATVGILLCSSTSRQCYPLSASTAGSAVQPLQNNPICFTRHLNEPAFPLSAFGT